MPFSSHPFFVPHQFPSAGFVMGGGVTILGHIADPTTEDQKEQLGGRMWTPPPQTPVVNHVLCVSLCNVQTYNV